MRQRLHERARLLGGYMHLSGLVACDRVGVLLPNVAEVLGTPQLSPFPDLLRKAIIFTSYEYEYYIHRPRDRYG